jgi:hypothetical protein
MLRPRPLLTIGITLIGLALLVIYQLDEPGNYGEPSSVVNAVLYGGLFLGMASSFVGSVKLCRQSSSVRLVVAAVCCLGIAAAMVGLASLSPSGLNPHGLGIVVGFPVLEAMVVSLMFGVTALLRWISRTSIPRRCRAQRY